MRAAAEGVARIDPQDKIIRSGKGGNVQPRRNHDRPGTGTPWSGELPPGVESLIAAHRPDTHRPSVAEFGKHRIDTAGRNATEEFDPPGFDAGAFLDAVDATGPEGTGRLVHLIG